jgi:hypothetical protein
MAADRPPFTVGFGVDSDQAELPQWVMTCHLSDFVG